MTDDAELSTKHGPTEDSLREIDDLLTTAIHASLDGLPLSDQVNAPVLIPGRDELAIRLVPLHSLERFQEAESDQNVASNALWCLIGSILGFITNVVTGGQKLTSAAILFLSMIALATILVSIWRRHLSKRSKPLRERLFMQDAIKND